MDLPENKKKGAHESLNRRIVLCDRVSESTELLLEAVGGLRDETGDVIDGMLALEDV